MDRLDEIVQHGNRSFHYGFRQNNWIRCRDGFRLSVIAGSSAHGAPRPAICTHAFGRDITTSPWHGEPACDYPGPYSHVEVGMPTARPEPWECPHLDEYQHNGLHWECYAEDRNNPTGTVYGYVPVDMVRALIASHGGEKVAWALRPVPNSAIVIALLVLAIVYAIWFGASTI